MKISLNLVKEFTEVKGSVNELLDLVSGRIAEISQVEYLAKRYDGIVVGKITEAKEHPDADKLGVYQVDIGGNVVQVVAGDKSLSDGDRVAYIPPGKTVPATVYDEAPLVIASRDLRGYKSEGMLASAEELYFASDNESVLKLDNDVKPGTPIVEAYDLDDVIIDIENKTLTNRPDAFGHIGLAREIAAVQGLQFSSPDWFKHAQTKFDITAEQLPLTIINELPELCPRYTAAAMRGIKVQASPLAIQSLLQRLGVRPINNIVDMTNYMMIVSAQPLHAFDYDKVEGGKIVVRHPKDGEQLELLNGKTIKPHAKAVLICDARQPIALGGVMGGANSEVSNLTTNIIIESANFDLYNIRETSMKHGILSDAVTRFSRGQDPNQCLPVLAQSVSMLISNGAALASPLLDDYPHRRQSKTIKVSPQRINQLLGTEYPEATIISTLKNVELEATGKAKVIEVKIPSWRPDLTIEADIAEEIGRLNGYNNIKAVLPSRSISPSSLKPELQLETTVRDLLVGAGSYELLTYSGVSGKLLDATGQDNDLAYKIRNAISPELEYMRMLILPSLLEKVHANIKRGFSQFSLFEIGKIRNQHDLDYSDKLPLERRTLALLTTADKKAVTQSHYGAAYYQAGEYLRYLLKQLGVGEWSLGLPADVKELPIWLQQLEASMLDPRSAVIVIGGEPIGLIGEFKHRTKSALKLPEFTAGFELDLEAIGRAPKTFKPIAVSRFPMLELDVCYRLPFTTTYRRLRQLIEETLRSTEYHWDLEALDIYAKDTTKAAPANNKQITHRLSLWHDEHTLTSEEGNQVVTKISDVVAKELDAKLV